MRTGIYIILIFDEYLIIYNPVLTIHEWFIPIIYNPYYNYFPIPIIYNPELYIIGMTDPLPCQVDGCHSLVHHLCQHAWEDKAGHEEYVPRVCCKHHPNYKYAHQPEKPVTPLRSTINPTHSKAPPKNLFSNPSPADSTITGGPGDFVAAKKQAPSIAAGKRGPKKRKDPPNSDVMTIAESNQGCDTLLGFDEHDADGSVHGDDTDDVLGDLGDSDEEGDEADIHHDGLLLRTVLEGSNQPIGDDADNIDMFAGEELQYSLNRRGSRSINGA